MPKPKSRRKERPARQPPPPNRGFRSQRQQSYSPPPAHTEMFRFEGRRERDNYRPQRSPPREPRRMNDNDSYRPMARHNLPWEDDRRPERSDPREFSFRSKYPAPQFPSQPSSNQRYDQQDRQEGYAQRRSRQRPRFQRGTHNRPILRALGDREKTPDLLEGMVDGDSRFRDLDEISESMDESSASDSNEDDPRKRQKIDPVVPYVVTTKWSNPDPYTVLPPTDEEPRAKKTDVVQLIRKAKLAASETNGAQKNDISGNVDFVALDSDSALDENDTESGEVEENDFLPLSQSENVVENRAVTSGITPSNTLTKSHHMQNHTNGNGISTTVSNQTDMKASTIGLPPKPVFDGMTSTKTSISESVIENPRKRKLDKAGNRLGDIVPEWAAISKAKVTPWIDVDHSETKQMGFW
jgi:non-canonical poly(A) RNA polymerase PAPD5/7